MLKAADPIQGGASAIKSVDRDAPPLMASVGYKVHMLGSPKSTTSSLDPAHRSDEELQQLQDKIERLEAQLEDAKRKKRILTEKQEDTVHARRLEGQLPWTFPQVGFASRF